MMDTIDIVDLDIKSVIDDGNNSNDNDDVVSIDIVYDDNENSIFDEIKSVNSGGDDNNNRMIV